MLSNFFQIGPVPVDHLTGTYDWRLVFLSYLVATMASYIALDITGRLHDLDNTKLTSTLWLLGGAFAMGAGIWSMHFIGMLAFKMVMPTSYDLRLTMLSMIVAILASGFALTLLRPHIIRFGNMALGGIVLGLAIASMHYIGMAAMNMKIHYIPNIFFLSIAIAIIASEAALWLALNSNKGPLRIRIRLKIASALIMGAAICGMHYTGMASAIFTPSDVMMNMDYTSLDPQILSIVIGLVAFVILSIAFSVSTYKEIMNYQAIRLAHEGGMAEVATNVLHNVGNVLNSINVSATLIEKYTTNTELSSLNELNELLEKNKNNLSEFVSTESGKELPGYIKILADCWKNENTIISRELKKLITNIQHIKEIIATQQTLSVMPHLEQGAHIEDLIEEALLMANVFNFEKTHINIERHYEKIQQLLINKVKVIQILINLIRNAKHSLIESTAEKKILSVRAWIQNKNILVIEVTDNGVGISENNISRVFTHGFTTKKDGHGFGLHSSAIAAKEMGGLLHCHSDGLDKGATFTLELPYKIYASVQFNRTQKTEIEKLE